MIDCDEVRTLLDTLCRTHGLDAFGIARVTRPKTADHYKKWLDCGYHGDMSYMESRKKQRLDATTLLENAKSFIMFAWSYHTKDATPHEVNIAAYAQGEDYHKRFKKALLSLWHDFKREANVDAKARIFVDSAPVLERDFASQSGLGWVGKNTCLIHPKRGSHFFIGEILTDLDLEPTESIRDHCGTCTACLDACPTDALIEPYTLDATRCISYLTIEKRGPFTANERDQVDNWAFGCDICQDVCPWNSKAPRGSYFEAERFEAFEEKSLMSLACSTEEEFKRRFARTPLLRTRFEGWQRNLDAVRNNLKKRAKKA